MGNLGKDLFVRLNELHQFNEECIHVTDLLRDLYRGTPSDQAFIRGKLYHMAIENLIMMMKLDKMIDVVEMEEPHNVSYTVKNRKVRLCFTPDSIVNYDGKNILLEIKSSSKSKDYAVIQTSIYRYLLEVFLQYRIDECRMITGDLAEYMLNCSNDVGKKELELRLIRSLFIYY